MTDGLPVVPPTRERVEAAIAATGRSPDELIALVAPALGRATVERIAVNAVMAGCRPEYLPVVIAGVEAMCDEGFSLVGVSGTTDAVAPVFIVNGPARGALGINAGAGALGPGHRANATIGRALRLLVRNVCRAVPNFLDRASYSTPARYSFCFGEDEEGSSPWVPMSVERGVPAGTSAVTVHSVMTMSSAVDLGSRTPEGVLDSIVAHIRTRGVATDEWLGIDNTVMLVMGPEHRRFLVDAGWSKDDARAYLFPRLKEGERPVRIGKPEGILIVGAGGPGMSETWVLFPHLAWAITEPVVPEIPETTNPGGVA